MLGNKGVFALGTVVCAVAAGCGGDDPSGSAMNAGGAGGSAGGSAASVAVVAGSAGANGGSTATTGGSAAAGAGGGTPGGKACQGTYGALTPVLAEEEGFSINGPSLTGDELQIFYSRAMSGVVPLTQVIVYRKRGTVAEAFGPVQQLPELATVCQPGQHVNPDISEDGLTLYVSCTNDVDAGPEGPSTLRVARRADKAAASFTLDAEPAGSVFASAGLSSDELTAYSGGETWGTAPQMFSRAAKTAKFGGAQAVPGITSAWNSPDISSDGLTLFGAALSDTSSITVVKRATRASTNEAFGAPSGLAFGLMSGALGAPNVTPRCALYVALAPGMPSPFTVQMALPQ